NITPVPRNWRICFLVRLIMPWRLPAEAYITLPVPVTLKRFFAPDLVFSLGIWLSCWPGNASQRPGSPAYARNERVCFLERIRTQNRCPLLLDALRHETTATAALERGGGRSGLWQTNPQKTTARAPDSAPSGPV